MRATLWLPRHTAIRQAQKVQPRLRRPRDEIIGNQPAPERGQAGVVVANPAVRRIGGTIGIAIGTHATDRPRDGSHDAILRHAEDVLDLDWAFIPKQIAIFGIEGEQTIRVGGGNENAPVGGHGGGDVAVPTVAGNFADARVAIRPRRLARERVDRRDHTGVRTENHVAARECQRLVARPRFAPRGRRRFANIGHPNGLVAAVVVAGDRVNEPPAFGAQERGPNAAIRDERRGFP